MARMSSYAKIILDIFISKYHNGDNQVYFTRDDLIRSAEKVGAKLPKNLGDILYSFRYRRPLPAEILQTAPDGMEWYIQGRGDAEYAFILTPLSARITPNVNLMVTKIPDATPEIIRAAAGTDEQALLAIVRYNRLIDTFLGITSYSLQNHLRTKVESIGQVEVDEIYVAIDSHGQQYIVPVEAKGHNDQIGRVQTEQDLAVCAAKWSHYTAIAVAVQFMSDEVVAMFELVMQDGNIKVIKEKHYELVKSSDISDEDRKIYAQASFGRVE